jgi:hypothetical protein
LEIEILLFSNPYELQTVSPLSKLMETSLWKPLENSPIPAILTRLHDADPWSTALPALPQLEMAKTPLVHLQCAGAVNESEAAVVAARHALEDSNDDVLIVADRVRPTFSRFDSNQFFNLTIITVIVYPSHQR